MPSEDTVTKHVTVVTRETDFDVKHFSDGSVIISQTGGFDGRERVYVPAEMFAAFVEAMARPKS